jgi:hypothetical protein
MPDDRYRLETAVRRKAKDDTKKGIKVHVTPDEIVQQLDVADKALNGDSNDAEHDALFAIREWMSELFESPRRRS